MNRTRIALLGFVAVLVAVWVSSAIVPPQPPARVPALAPRSARDTHPASRTAASRDVTSFDLDEAAQRLRLRIDTAPSPRMPERNPFEFAKAPAPRVAPAAPIAVSAPLLPVGPVPPPFTLTGVAEQQKDNNRTERTAILSASNGSRIYYAKAGDVILGRYEVTAVGAEAIELRETDSGQIVRLGLR
jgi:hypothetical protein